MQPAAGQSTSGAFRGGWGRIFHVVRLRRRNRTAEKDLENSPARAIDPIALTIIAVNRLGPATLRAVSLGVPVTVAAPDRWTAAIFRAALSQMEKTRPTDRLVSVELVKDA